jgi:hypothetical protein
MKEIKIKVNKVLFTVEYEKKGSIVFYSLARNKKTLICSTTAKKQADEVKMNIYRDLSEAIGYEIRSEIEKLNQ